MSETPPVTPPATPPVTPPDWKASFKPDMQNFVTERGFTGPEQVVEQYRNLEKLRGVPPDQLLTLPKSLDDATAMAPIYDRLGRPKDSKGYTLEVPKDGDPKQAEWAGDLFHKNGLTKTQGEAIVKGWNERQAAAVAANLENVKIAKAQTELALRKEWGAAYDQNTALVDKGAKTLGLTPEQVESLGGIQGRDVFMKKLADIGRSLGEAPFITGNKTTGGENVLAPEQAQAKINELMKTSDFTQKLYAGDPIARKTWDTLHEQMAFQSR